MCESCLNNSFNLVIEYLLISTGPIPIRHQRAPGWFQSRNRVSSNFNQSDASQFRVIDICFNLVIEYLLISTTYGKKWNAFTVGFQSRNRVSSNFNCISKSHHESRDLFQSRNRVSSNFNSTNPYPASSGI